MSTGFKQPSLDGSGNPSSVEEKQGKINEVRRLIRPQPDLANYCSDECISRYLRARNWNVKKAVKMLKTSLKWRSEFKPEEIRWEDVAQEAETGKIYRTSYKDKYGRPVLVMRPRCQNSKSIKGQIKYLVYCMEKAISNLSHDQEQMVWLIDFHGFSLSNISVKVTRETAYVLQEQYPERLGIAILYDPPKIFEPFWMIAKPFLEPKTADKVKFVYSDDPNSSKILNELFNMELVESAFGGKDDSGFDISRYAERMKADDEKQTSLWRANNNLVASALPPAISTSSLNATNSESESDDSYAKVDKSSSPRYKEEEEEKEAVADKAPLS
ncbi:random slug protein 5-like [Dorcoceras hygrometricum]|uniref:Random slug protein 5-like n=1 Tax=Dorcoceras hygrometricum TaxID=472368 RepID=A0A2Z7C468_9LAMI|nr:random slug protein 5-like [Dorcoceras hygrometricum]